MMISEKLRKRLNQFRELENGWLDEEEGLEISEKALQVAEMFVAQFSEKELEGMDIGPTVSGGLILDWLPESEKETASSPRWMMEIVAAGDFFISTLNGEEDGSQDYPTFAEAVANYRDFTGQLIAG